MSESFNEIKDSFFKTYFYDREFITNEEYEKLDYKIDYTWDDNQLKYFKKIPVDVTNDEIYQFVAIKVFQSISKVNDIQNSLSDMNKNIKTIKDILVFWLAIGIIGAIIAIANVL